MMSWGGFEGDILWLKERFSIIGFPVSSSVFDVLQTSIPFHKEASVSEFAWKRSPLSNPPVLRQFAEEGSVVVSLSERTL